MFPAPAQPPLEIVMPSLLKLTRASDKTGECYFERLLKDLDETKGRIERRLESLHKTQEILNDPKVNAKGLADELTKATPFLEKFLEELKVFLVKTQAANSEAESSQIKIIDLINAFIKTNADAASHAKELMEKYDTDQAAKLAATAKSKKKKGFFAWLTGLFGSKKKEANALAA